MPGQFAPEEGTKAIKWKEHTQQLCSNCVSFVVTQKIHVTSRRGGGGSSSLHNIVLLFPLLLVFTDFVVANVPKGGTKVLKSHFNRHTLVQKQEKDSAALAEVPFLPAGLKKGTSGPEKPARLTLSGADGARLITSCA